MKRTLVTLTALALAGCTSAAGQSAAPAATADLEDVQGQSIGTAGFTEQDGKVRLVVEAKGLTPGQHGIHIHAVGRCEPPAFTSAGGHYNPRGARHGLEAPDGPHAGDLPNLTADQNGDAHYETTTDRITLGEGPLSIFDADGSALVIHEKEDDQKSDPAGNSGGRVACGVIQKRA